MSGRLSLRRPVLICILFHCFLVARGGGDSDDEFGPSDDLDGSSSFHLAPMDTAHFAFCVIFSVLTALQTLQAVNNIRRRIVRLPPSISSPEFSVGSIFPTSLLLSTICRTISYALHAVYWVRTTNLQDRYPVYSTPTYLRTWNAMGFLADIFLLSAILALLSHREKILINTPPIIRSAKKVVDTILVGVLTSLSLGSIGMGAAGDETVGHKLYLAYLSFFLFGVLDVAVSSTILYAYSRESSVDDHSIILYTSFIISPLFFVYSVFPLLMEGLLKPDIVPSADKDQEQWALASLVVGCITEVVIVQACLTFGMPSLSKDDDE